VVHSLLEFQYLKYRTVTLSLGTNLPARNQIGGVSSYRDKSRLC